MMGPNYELEKKTGSIRVRTLVSFCYEQEKGSSRSPYNIATVVNSIGAPIQLLSVAINKFYSSY
jgi:hypothetical protein